MLNIRVNLQCIQQCPEARALSIFKWENKGKVPWWGDDGGMLPQGFTFPIKQKLHFPIYQHCSTTKEDKYKTQRKVYKCLVHPSMHSAIQSFVSLLWMPAACCFFYAISLQAPYSWKNQLEIRKAHESQYWRVT